MWGIRNLQISGNAANRSLLFHPLTADKLMEGAQTFVTFLLPDRFNLYTAAPVFWNAITILVLISLYRFDFLVLENIM